MSDLAKELAELLERDRVADSYSTPLAMQNRRAINTAKKYRGLCIRMSKRIEELEAGQ